MADKSPVQRIKELDQERNKLLGGAKKEALDRANQSVADLKTLGFKYLLIPEVEITPVSARGRKGTRTVKNAPCPICKFKTAPPHDARKHRFAQGKKKRPFATKELADLGLKKL